MDLEVLYKGQVACSLNESLVKSQKLTELDISVLKSLHCDRLSLFDKMKIMTNSLQLKQCAEEMKRIEFSMQEAWKFPLDEKKHTWWFQLPKCSCPKMDNRERYGTGNYIINQECLLHGS